MDYRSFLEELPNLYERWGYEDARPKNHRFAEILSDVTGLTTPGVMQLLNAAVSCLSPGEIYCEIGSYRGSTLVGALIGHDQTRAIAVDNFSEFDPENSVKASLAKTVDNYGLRSQVDLIDSDFEQFFKKIKKDHPPRIGVYLYDGAHDYLSQLTGLLLVSPYLADQGLIVVDDSNWQAVRQANADFMARHPEARFELRLTTPANGHPSFWNGVDVLSWDVDRRNASPYSHVPRARLSDATDRPAIQLIHQGRAARDEDRVEDALDCFRQAMARDPGEPAARIETARVLRSRRLASAARDCLSDAARIWPTNPIVALEVAAAAELVGDAATAHSQYLRATELNPCLAWAYPGAADHLCDLGRFTEAEELLDRGLESTDADHPARPWLLQRKAVARLGRTDVGGAGHLLATVLALTKRVSVLTRPVEFLASRAEYTTALALLEDLRPAAKSYLDDWLTYERLFNRVLQAERLHLEAPRRGRHARSQVVAISPRICASEWPIEEKQRQATSEPTDITKFYVEGDLLPEGHRAVLPTQIADTLERDLQAVSTWPVLRQHRQAYFLYEARNCFVFDCFGLEGPAVILGNKWFLKDLVFPLSPLNLSRRIVIETSKCQSLPAAFVLPTNTGWSNYYHALVDTLSSLYWYERLELSCPIVIPGPMTDMHESIFGAMELISDAEVLTAEQINGVPIDLAYCPEIVRGQLARQWWIEQSMRVTDHRSVKSESVAYISREGSRSRMLTNENKLQETLQQRFGARIVRMEELSFEEQMQAAAASILVGPHGAGLTNMIFAKGPSTIVELMPDRYCLSLFRDLAAISGHSHCPIVGVTQDPESMTWKIDIEKVSRVIQARLESGDDQATSVA